MKNIKQLLLMAGLLLLAPGLRATEAAAPKPPNIVFIFSDDHAWQAVSAYGSNLIQTPNIDRIAREGIRFDRCLVPNSICGPSRATVLTGTYNHINGFIDNTNCRFDGSQTTFPKLLQRANYQTAIIGKWHLESDPTGFDHWQILPGQGAYYNPPMIRNGEKIVEPGYVTDIITARSLEWLKQRDPSRPFLLMCQHKAPHRNWLPNVTQLNRDGDRHYPEPATLFDNYAGRGKGEREQDMNIARTMHDGDVKLKQPGGLNREQLAAWNAYYEPRNEAFRKANLQGDDLIRWKYQRYMHDYLACIASVDDSIGQVLDYLKASGLEENTIVVYASDQGFFLGEHGWFDKRWIFEESARTPFVMRWPGKIKPGSTTKALVSNLDFAETFLTAANVPVPTEMQGRILQPLFSGQTPADWRQSFYYHYYEHPGVHNVPRHYGVVTDRYKLVHFYEPDYSYWELFDLQTDPQEMKSVFDDPAYLPVRQELETELKRLRLELKVPDQDPQGNAGPASKTAKAFVHPGILHNRKELTFVKQQIAAGSEPWKSAWEKLRTSKSAALDYVPRPRPEVVRGPYNKPNIGSSEMSADAAAAYTQALAWALTGHEAHAKKTVEILNAWSATLKIVSGHDTKLLIGMTGVQFCAAAEIIKHTYTGWSQPDQKRFEQLVREILYPPIKDFNPRANGNWDASMIQTMLAMGIFLDDRPMFDRAVQYYLHGEGNGAIGNYFNAFGECQESGRDQGHTQMGLGFLGCAAEIAWKQGVDLYGAADSRLALGFEYTAKYNLGHDVPYEPYRSFEGVYNNPEISAKGRGEFAPIYERIVYHYHGRKGLEMPYSRQVAAKPATPGRSTAHIPWGSLMFAEVPGAKKTK